MSTPKTKKTIPLSSTILKRAKVEAIAYIENQLRVCYQDCSDSGEEADRHEARLSAIVEDRLTMDAFIEEYLLPEYAAMWKAFIQELLIEGWDMTEDDKENPSVLELPVSYDRFKHLL